MFLRRTEILAGERAVYVFQHAYLLLYRALEASIQDNKRHGYPSRLADPLNPNDRRRVPDHGVGLKNIGNTCWFSAVIQVRYTS